MDKHRRKPATMLALATVMGAVAAAGTSLTVPASQAVTAPSTVTLPPRAPFQAAAVPVTGANADTSAFAKKLEKKFVDPDRVYSTDVRWWLGEASNTDESLLSEIQALYDGGFRGVELCMQSDPAAPTATYAYGSPMWTHKWNLMMNRLLDLGMSVYLTSGTNWSTSNVPGLDPTSQAAMQNVTLGTGTVDPGQSITSIPAPAASAQKAGAKFITAYAYKVTSGNTVDPSTYVNLAPLITQGADTWTQNLSWTAPTDGTYRIFGLWTQGTYQSSSPSTTPSYATNYFDTRGVDALKAFWEQHYLSDPALVKKIKDNGDVQLFMDSLEINTGTGFTWWAQDMASEFQKRKGYDITPYLFLINGVAATPDTPYKQLKDIGTYRLDGDEKLRQKVINDYQDVLTQLYMERMLTPLKTWLNSYGIKTRAQISYGRPLEISEPEMAVDYPEAENLNQYNQVDLYRLWTGGAKLQNKVLSSETGAEIAPYNATRQLDLKDAYSEFAAGFQRVVWHVWGADYGYGSYQWPGFSAGNFRYLGSRNPDSADYDEFNAHLGRVQQLLQTGESRTDVGFLYQNWTQGMAFLAGIGSDNNNMNWQLAHQGVIYRSTELQDNGYTYDYFSPKFLTDPNVHFDPQTKTIEKSGYKAVVLLQDWLNFDAAKKLLAWAKQGLKVVIVENAGSKTPGNDGKDSALKKVMDELKTLPTVRQATVYDNIDYFSSAPGGYDDNVLEKLQELGVQPYTGYSQPNQQLLTQTRQDADGNRYVYVYNYDDGSYRDKSLIPAVRNARNPGTNIKTDIEVQGKFVPYTIDPWTGQATQLAQYRWEDGKTVVPIDLDYNNIDLLAFEKVEGNPAHIVSTGATTSYAVPGGVTVRATDSGKVTTTLSNGRSYQDDVRVPAPYDISDWDLTVQSWTPNPTAGDLSRTETVDGVTTTDRSTSTIKTPIDVKLDKLTTWNNIPEVGKGVSGTGHYEASFNWDAASASGAYLDFGQLNDSMKVWINGKQVGGNVSTNPTKVKKDVGGVGKPTIDDGTGAQVPLVGKDLYTGGIDWTKPIADISPYLVDGENTIVIDYSSTLSNVQLNRGAIPVQTPKTGYRNVQWWHNDQDYVAYGPSQAKIIPFVDVEHAKSTHTSLSAPVARGTYGQATTVTVRVGGDAPSGTVALTEGRTVLGRADVSDGTARFVLSGTRLSAGVHLLQASYSGDDANGPGSATVRVSMAKANAMVRARIKTRARTRPKVSVEVSASGVVPGGRVIVRGHGKVIAKGVLDARGAAVLRLRTLKGGKHHLRVVYLGNPNVSSSTARVTVTVRR